MKVITLVSFLLVFSSLTLAQPPSAAKPQETPPPAKQAAADDAPTVTKHSVRVGAKQLNYTVTTGFMPLKNAVTGDTEARIFFMAYTLDNAPAGRPLMFSFNGGPGSASVWLHLGTIGPRRVKMLDDELLPICNMFGYCQVASAYGSGSFLNVLQEAFPGGRADEAGPKLITSKVNGREDLIESLKTFFKAGR